MLLKSCPGDETMHKVRGIHGVVRCVGNQKPAVELARAQEISVLLLLKQLHHVVDKLAVRSGRSDPQIHLSFLTHLKECFFHFNLPSKLVILDGNNAEEHHDVVAAHQESEHAVLSANGH